MYTFKKTYVKNNFRWEDRSIANETMLEAIKHQDVRITVIVTSNGEERDIFLSRNREACCGSLSNVTITNWVKTLVSDSVVTSKAARGLVDAKTATYKELETIAIKLEKGSILYPNKKVIPYGMDTDIMFSTGREEADVFHEYNICKYIMPIVNGSFHPMQYIDKKVFIINGMDSVRADNKNVRTDFIDFTDIGTLEQYLLATETEMKLVPRNAKDVAEEVQRIAITVAGDNHTNLVSNKLPMLVVNGNIRLFTDDIEVVSEDTIVYKMRMSTEIYLASKNIPNTKRYLSPVNLTKDAVDVATFDVLEYMKGELCFLVLLDSPDVSVYIDYMQPSDGPMQYVHNRAPKGMLFFDDGRVTHWNIQGFNSKSVSIITDDNERGDSHYDRTLLRNTVGYSDNHFATGNTNRLYHRAYSLDIYSFS